jgi:hypothetical protein
VVLRALDPADPAGDVHRPPHDDDLAGLFDDVRRIRKVPLDWEQVFKTWAVAALVVAGLWFFGPKVLVWSLGR